MVPTQFVSRAVAMAADGGPETLHLGDERLAVQLLQVLVYAAAHAADRRRRAADLACFDKAVRDTVFFGSRLSFRRDARARLADGRRRAAALPARYRSG